jgi:predicted kinase
MLISLSGLPGVGETTIARELARQIGAVHLSIDTIEQAIRSSIGVKTTAIAQPTERHSNWRETISGWGASSLLTV